MRRNPQRGHRRRPAEQWPHWAMCRALNGSGTRDAGESSHFTGRRHWLHRQGVAGHLLENVPNIRKITLLVRRNRNTSAQRRFEKIIEESPAFDTLQARHGRQLGAF